MHHSVFLNNSIIIKVIPTNNNIENIIKIVPKLMLKSAPGLEREPKIAYQNLDPDQEVKVCENEPAAIMIEETIIALHIDMKPMITTFFIIIIPLLSVE